MRRFQHGGDDQITRSCDQCRSIAAVPYVENSRMTVMEKARVQELIAQLQQHQQGQIQCLQALFGSEGVQDIEEETRSRALTMLIL